MQDLTPKMFSKYQDPVSGLYYYGYRYYAPTIGRWVNRDPIGEEGGLNLFQFAKNNPISLLDFLGESAANPCPPNSPGGKCFDLTIVSVDSIEANGSNKNGDCPSDMMLNLALGSTQGMDNFKGQQLTQNCSNGTCCSKDIDGPLELGPHTVRQHFWWWWSLFPPKGDLSYTKPTDNKRKWKECEMDITIKGHGNVKGTIGTCSP